MFKRDVKFHTLNDFGLLHFGVIIFVVIFGASFVMLCTESSVSILTYNMCSTGPPSSNYVASRAFSLSPKE